MIVRLRDIVVLLCPAGSRRELQLLSQASPVSRKAPLQPAFVVTTASRRPARSLDPDHVYLTPSGNPHAPVSQEVLARPAPKGVCLMKTTGQLIERQVVIPPFALDGDLVIPENAVAVVAFAHGSGSSRRSPRNQYVARVLQDGRLATLLLDLLTRDEERIDAVTLHLRFDIALLAHRLSAAVAWLK